MSRYYSVTLDHDENDYIFKKRENADSFLWNYYMSSFPEESREQRIDAQHELNTTSSIQGVGTIYQGWDN